MLMANTGAVSLMINSGKYGKKKRSERDNDAITDLKGSEFPAKR